MGGRGANYDAAKQVTGQYSITGVSENKKKIVSFFRAADRSAGGTNEITEETYERAVKLANELVDDIQYRDDQLYSDYKSIKAALSGTYSISDRDRADIPDFNRYMRSSENNIKISRNGRTSFDSMYEDLARRFQAYFDAQRTAAVSDRMIEVNNVLNMLKSPVATLSRSEKRAVADELTLGLISAWDSRRRRAR